MLSLGGSLSSGRSVGTEVNRVGPSPAAGSSRLVVLLPGNPGDVIFYEQVAAELDARSHAVLLCSPPCWSPEIAAAGLAAHAQHHADTVRRHLASRSPTAPTEIVLVGHSVGAYFAHLIVAHRLLSVSALIMLFPFLARPRISGRMILAAASWSWLHRPLLGLVRALPAAALDLLMGAGELTHSAREAARDDRARCWLALARAERREIAGRADAGYLFDDPLFADAARFAVLLAPRDRWVSKQVEQQLSPFAHHCQPPVTHAFVIHPEARRLVVDRLHDLLSGRGCFRARGP